MSTLKVDTITSLASGSVTITPVSRGAVDGLASLDSTGKVPAAQLRSPYTIEAAANAAARNALTVITAEIAVRQVRLTDTGVIYVPNAAGTGAGIWMEFNSVGTASTGSAGVVQLATAAEAVTGTNALNSITPSTLQAGVAPLRNALAPAQGLVLNGTARATATLGTAVGVLDYTFRAKIKVAALTAAHQTAYTLGGANALLVRPTTGYILDEGGVYTAGVVAGITSDVAIVRTGGVSYLYINGVLKDQHANTYDFSSSTVNIGAANSNTDPLTGVLSDQLIYNRALSAAEVLALYQSGAPAAADYDYANQLTTAWTVGGTWSSFVSSSSTNISGTLSNGSSHTRVDSTSFVRGNWGVSLLWRLRFDATITGGSGINVFQYNGDSYSLIGSQAATGSFDVSFTGPANAYAGGNAVYIQNVTGTATTIALTNIKLERFGLLLAPDSAQAGGGLVWYDTSGNAANITLPATGVSWNVPTSGKAFSLSLASTTAGSSGAGALVLQGGISAGNTGSAASYFGGTITAVGTGSHVFGTTNTVTMAAGVQTNTFALSNEANGLFIKNINPGGWGGVINFYGAQNDATQRIASQIATTGVNAWTDASTSTSSMLLKTINAGTLTTALTLSGAGNATFAGAVTVSGGSALVQSGTAHPFINIKATADNYNPYLQFQANDRSFYMGVKDTGNDGLFSIAAISALTDPLFSINAATLAATFSGAVTVAGNTIIGTTSTINNARITAQFQSSSGNTGMALVDAQANNTASFINFYSNVTAIGSITNNNNTATAYNTSSDYRLKNSIAPMTGALAKVALLKPVTYKWNVNNSDGQGFVAHELAEVAPYAVTGEKDGERMQGVDYGKITPLLAAALQEAVANIKSLEARLAALEAK